MSLVRSTKPIAGMGGMGRIGGMGMGGMNPMMGMGYGGMGGKDGLCFQQLQVWVAWVAATA